MAKLAKRMKKNNIAVDIVAFGSLEGTETQKVEAFYDAIKPAAEAGSAADEYASHLEIFPPGPSLLSDKIRSSPMLGGGGAGAGGSNGDDFGMGGDGGGGGGDFEFGVDPSQDPELALALRMSMEEEERRVAREQEAQAREEGRTHLESVAEEGGEGEKKEDDKKDGDDQPHGEGADDADKMDTA